MRVSRVVGVHAPDLGGLHVDGGPLVQVDDGLGVHDPLAGALAVAVVALHIADLEFLPMWKVWTPSCWLVSQPVLWMPQPATMSTSQSSPMKKVVVHQLGKAGLADDNGDVDRLVLGAAFHGDVDARLARLGLGGDLNVGGVVAGVQLSVAPDVVGPLRGLFQVRDLLEELHSA